MSRHRGTPPPRYRTRYGRVVALGASVATTVVALLGGVGVLTSSADGGSGSPEAVVAADLTQPRAQVPTPEPTDEFGVEPTDESGQESGDTPTGTPTGTPTEEAQGPIEQVAVTAPAVPGDSGEGRRVVFSETDQRVWLVGSAGKVRRTYLVSGSLTDNLDPGTYQVYSRSEDAFGIDDSGTMKWFVRFTQGPTGAAIGFHTIPIDEGKRVQGKADLGTPQSHGCIRQSTPDALAMWAFAPLGTTVVVV